jgi:hypothetical protein
MSREKIAIDLSCPFHTQPGAKFLAALAYPMSADRYLRDRYARALCRSEVLKRAIQEPGYANNLQLITPNIFEDDDDVFWRALRTGMKKFTEKVAATVVVVIPYFGRFKIDGEDPSVNRLGTLAAHVLGKKNLSSFKSDVWASTRPVAHVMSAYVLWQFLRISETTNFFAECLNNPRVVAQLIKTSEEIRLKLPIIKEYKRRILLQQEMIQFHALVANGTLDDFIGAGLTTIFDQKG